MGKKKKVHNIHVGEQETDENDDDPLLSEFLSDKVLRRSPRHIASLLHSVKEKETNNDIVGTKKKSDLLSPLPSDSSPSCINPNMEEKGCSRPRGKMDNFKFDDHLEKIWGSLSEDKRSSFALLKSMCFLYYNMGQERGLNMVKTKNIFSKKYVLVPVVRWDHCRLAVFCHLGESRHSKIRARCILLLDSMETNVQQIKPDLRRFVFDIFKADGRPEIKDDIYKIPILEPKVPQQSNDVDCGRFVLYFIKMFMDSAPENFSLKDGYPYFMTRDWFTSENFEEFCEKLEKEAPFNPEEDEKSERRYSQRIRSRSRRQKHSQLRMEDEMYFSQLSKAELEVIQID